MTEAESHNHRGIALRRQGSPAEAIAAFDAAISLAPDNTDAHNNRGNALRDLARHDEAAAAYRRAIQINPNQAAPHANLGNIFFDQQKYNEAIPEYAAALRIDPTHLPALNHLANLLRVIGRASEAEPFCREALRLDPNSPQSHLNLGNILYDKQKFPEAIQSIELALKLQPNNAIAHNNLSLALAAVGRSNEAITAAKTAVKLNPDYPDGFNTLANFLADNAQYTEAESAFKRAIHLHPDFPLAHWNYAAIPLLRGDFETGWAEHEWRTKSTIPSTPRQFPQPQWTGDDPTNKTILLHPEQGFGDTLQFVRYAPLLAARGARLLLSCPKELSSLLQESFPFITIVNDPFPHFDLHSPLLSLPFAFQTRLNTIPAQTPYLKAPADKIESWKKLINPKSRKLRVGLAWTGNPKRKLNHRRSIDPALLHSLIQNDSAEFYSLQKDQPAPALNLIDHTSRLSDFSDTAALIEHLDLVITIDTAVAHLAGALAKPVWLLLDFVPAWRWMLDRSDSPWYPTMRLFRQKTMDDWTAPIAQVAKELREKTAR